MKTRARLPRLVACGATLTLALTLSACGDGDGGSGSDGKIHVEEQKVPRMGKFSLFTDSEGRMMGLWKAKR